MPAAGMVRLPVVPMTAENLSCTPASENRRTIARETCSGETGPSFSAGQVFPPAGVIVIAPGRSRPSVRRRKNSQFEFTPAFFARYSRNAPSGSKLEGSDKY